MLVALYADVSCLLSALVPRHGSWIQRGCWREVLKACLCNTTSPHSCHAIPVHPTRGLNFLAQPYPYRRLPCSWCSVGCVVQGTWAARAIVHVALCGNTRGWAVSSVHRMQQNTAQGFALLHTRLDTKCGVQPYLSPCPKGHAVLCQPWQEKQPPAAPSACALLRPLPQPYGL